MRRNLSLALLLAFCWAAPASAQRLDQAMARAQLSQQEVVTMQRDTLWLWVEVPAGTAVAFPELGDTLAAHVEVRQQFVVDTTALADGRLRLRRGYLLASDRGGQYALPRLPVVLLAPAGPDTLFADSLRLVVSEPEIDPSNPSMGDLKGPENTGFDFDEFWALYGWWLSILLLVLAAGLFLWMRWLARKRKAEADALPRYPPHVEARMSLEALAAKQLWQNNQVKEYYSELTDILRHYLERRFGINAMELTSHQIALKAKYDQRVPEKAYIALKRVLESSDLAKFAKATPQPQENEANLAHAHAFVDETAPQETAEADAAENDSKPTPENHRP